MLTVAQPYFQRDDFRGAVILHAAVAHPLLKRLVRFECGRNSAMRANDRTDGLPWEFGSGVDQGDDVHLLASCLFPVSDLNAMRP
jgi:hypothetical protein